MMELILVTIFKIITGILLGCLILILFIGFVDSVQRTVDRQEEYKRRLKNIGVLKDED